MSSPGDVDRFGASLGGMMEELDWERLGRTYCWENGEDFFGEEDRERLLDAGLAIATDLGTALSQVAANGRSLYVGAGVAELVPMAFEAIVMGRRIVARSLDGEEVQEITRAATAVASRIGEGPSMPLIAGQSLEEHPLEGTFDHLWFVSVISDPEAFPALHDKLYGRRTGDSDFATGKGDLAADEAKAESLVALAVGALMIPAVVTTTDEELPFFKAAVASLGLKITVPKAARLSPIVGDPIRHCFVEAAS